MRRVFPLMALVLAVSGCGNEGRAIRLNGKAYFFPDQHIRGIVDPKDYNGHYYVRLAPPGGYYWLVYDPVRELRPNTLGPDIPTIRHISDWNLNVIPKSQEVRVVKTAAGPVVCKRHPVNDESAYLRELFTCGFRIYDEGVPWSVLIPGDLVESAPALKRRAQLTLANYRRDARALKAK